MVVGPVGVYPDPDQTFKKSRNRIQPSSETGSATMVSGVTNLRNAALILQSFGETGELLCCRSESRSFKIPGFS